MAADYTFQSFAPDGREVIVKFFDSNTLDAYCSTVAYSEKLDKFEQLKQCFENVLLTTANRGAMVYFGIDSYMEYSFVWHIVKNGEFIYNGGINFHKEYGWSVNT